MPCPRSATSSDSRSSGGRRTPCACSTCTPALNVSTDGCSFSRPASFATITPAAATAASATASPCIEPEMSTTQADRPAVRGPGARDDVVGAGPPRRARRPRVERAVEVEVALQPAGRPEPPGAARLRRADPAELQEHPARPAAERPPAARRRWPRPCPPASPRRPRGPRRRRASNASASSSPTSGETSSNDGCCWRELLRGCACGARRLPARPRAGLEARRVLPGGPSAFPAARLRRPAGSGGSGRARAGPAARRSPTRACGPRRRRSGCGPRARRRRRRARCRGRASGSPRSRARPVEHQRQVDRPAHRRAHAHVAVLAGGPGQPDRQVDPAARPAR